MAKKTKSKSKMDKECNKKIFAFLATFLSIIGFIIALLAKRDDKYVMHYAKQSLVVFITSLLAGVVSWVFVYTSLAMIIQSVLNILVFILWILSWIYALSGKEKEVPVVGQYARKIDL